MAGCVYHPPFWPRVPAVLQLMMAESWPTLRQEKMTLLAFLSRMISADLLLGLLLIAELCSPRVPTRGPAVQGVMLPLLQMQ